MIVHLVKNHGLIPALIRWQTRSKYTHAAIQVCSEVWESVGSGVKVSYETEFRRHYKGLYDSFYVDASTDQEAIARKFLNKQTGKPYDFTMIIRFLTRQQETRESRGKWFCSELVYAALTKAGVKVLSRIEPWQVSPAMLSYSPALKKI